MAIIGIQEYKVSNTSSKIEIEIINYTINSNAVARVNFLDTDNKSISSVVIYITEDDFHINWIDDNSLADLIFNKLGLTLAPTV